MSNSNFSNLKRIENGFYTSGNGLGFALGGNEGSVTTTAIASLYDIVPTPGLVIFNSSSLYQ